MKHLIKENEIFQSGIPPTFTRENGEAFWGGYQNRTDIHYKDGWRDDVIPEYDPLKEQLGDQYFDAENDVVTYEINPLVIDLEFERKRQFDELTQIRTELANLITQAKLNCDPEPPELTTLVSGIKAMYAQAKSDIAGLTEADVLKYNLRSPQLMRVTALLESFL